MPLVAKPRDGGIVEGKLLARQDDQFVDLLDAQLGLWIECSQGIDLVVEQVNAHRKLGAHWKNVHHRATDSVLATLGDRICGVITRSLQSQTLLFRLKQLTAL